MNKKTTTHKLTALLLTLVMVLGMMPMTALAADDIMISYASFAVPEPEGGLTVPTKSDFILPAGANYTVEFVIWKDYDTSEWIYSGNTFKDGKSYELTVQLRAKDGYKFAEDVSVTVNWDNNIFSYLKGDDVLEIKHVFSKSEFLMTSASITVAEPAGGETVPGESDIILPEGANYTVDYVEWCDAYNGDYIAPGDTFQSGKTYELYVTLRPKYGYQFVDHVSITVNGTNYSDGYNQPRWEGALDIDYVFQESVNLIKSVSFSYGEAVEGATVPGESDIILPEGANYTIDYIYWRDENSDDIAPGSTFQYGKSYTLFLRLKANVGYRFDVDSYTINGAKGDNFYSHNDGNFIHQIEHWLKIPINEINQVGLTLRPCVGQTLGEFTAALREQIKDEPYTVDFIEVGNSSDPGYIFTEGEKLIYMRIKPKTGCAFINELKDGDEYVAVNGEYTYCWSDMDDTIGIQPKITVTNAVTVSGSFTSYGDDTNTTVRLLKDNAEILEYRYFGIGTKSGNAYTGTWTIENVVPGDYTLEVSKVNHVEREYSITVGSSPVTQDVEIWLRGDVNGDGKMNTTDVVIYLRYIAGWNGVAFNPEVADANGDGKYNTSDVVLMLRFIAGWNIAFGGK